MGARLLFTSCFGGTHTPVPPIQEETAFLLVEPLTSSVGGFTFAPAHDEQGGKQMQIIERKITELKPYANNPRLNDAAVDAVAASIKNFGFKVPIILDRDGEIIAGHTRLKAAQKLKMKTVPVIIADDLTPEQVKAFRLADNKVGELAGWDFEKLDLELAEIDLDMSQFGFGDDDNAPPLKAWKKQREI